MEIARCHVTALLRERLPQNVASIILGHLCGRSGSGTSHLKPLPVGFNSLHHLCADLHDLFAISVRSLCQLGLRSSFSSSRSSSTSTAFVSFIHCVAPFVPSVLVSYIWSVTASSIHFSKVSEVRVLSGSFTDTRLCLPSRTLFTILSQLGESAECSTEVVLTLNTLAFMYQCQTLIMFSR